MNDNQQDERGDNERDNQADKRVFAVQVCLVCIVLALVLIGAFIETQFGEDRSFGFFWYAFLAGCLGASTRLFIIQSNEEATVCANESWYSILNPVFFGG